MAAAPCARTSLAEDMARPGIGFLGVSLALGFDRAAGAYAVGPLSGGQFKAP
jgi:glycerol uptake facilitator-like aquaporin